MLRVLVLSCSAKHLQIGHLSTEPHCVVRTSASAEHHRHAHRRSNALRGQTTQIRDARIRNDPSAEISHSQCMAQCWRPKRAAPHGALIPPSWGRFSYTPTMSFLCAQENRACCSYCEIGAWKNCAESFSRDLRVLAGGRDCPRDLADDLSLVHCNIEKGFHMTRACLNERPGEPYRPSDNDYEPSDCQLQVFPFSFLAWGDLLLAVHLRAFLRFLVTVREPNAC